MILIVVIGKNTSNSTTLRKSPISSIDSSLDLNKFASLEQLVTSVRIAQQAKFPA